MPNRPRSRIVATMSVGKVSLRSSSGAAGMTSRCTNARTVAMISARTESSMGWESAPVTPAPPSSRRKPYTSILLTLNLNSEKNVSPMRTGLMHHGLVSAAHQFPEHPGVLAGDDCWTFAELDRAGNAVARHLADHGVVARDRIAVMTTNRPE